MASKVDALTLFLQLLCAGLTRLFWGSPLCLNVMVNNSITCYQGDPQFFIVRFDVETRSKIDLRKVGPWVYAKHPSTELLVLSYALGDLPVQTFVPDMMNGCKAPSEWVYLVSQPTTLFEAFNAFFEWSIYYHVLVKRFGWPTIAPERWLCAMAASNYYALPSSLDMVADNALHLEHQKDKEGHRVMMKLSGPRKPSKNNPAWYHPNQADFEKLYTYCEKDVETHRAISNTIGGLPESEVLIWRVDQMINRRGVYCDIEAVRGAIYILDTVMGWYQDEMKEVTGGFVETTGQLEQIKSFCLSRGVYLENLQAGTIQGLLDQIEFPSDVKRVLELRLAASKSSVKKYQAMLNRVDTEDNRIRSTLKYHGASTGRWSGKGIQPQNFPRGTFAFYDPEDSPNAPHIEDIITLIKIGDIDGLKEYGDVASILSSALRSMLCAAPGKKLIAADYSAIEARVLFWLVGEDKGTRVFETSGLVYEDMASTIYDIPVHKVDKKQRWLGKQAVLGLGYQMGWKKFKEQCTGHGVDVSDTLCKRVVNAYRSKYTKVVSYWEQVNTCALLAIQSNKPVSCGKVTFFCENDFSRIRLPSGRCISYHRPHLVPSRYNPNESALAYWGMVSQSNKWKVIHTYGGKLTENIVQAIAGCLLRQAILNLESNGYPIVMSVHDELVCEVWDSPEYSVKTMSKLMCLMPSWADGLPLKADGWQGKRFKK